MTDLPSGWRSTTLGDLGNYWNGRAFKKSEWRTAGRPIIRIQNLTGSSDAFNYFDGDAEARYTARPGDLLVSWAATLGAFLWSGPEAVVNQHIFKVDSFIDVRLHKHLLDLKLAELARQAHGSGIVHITRGVFDGLQVQIPESLEGQASLVAVLEDHLSRLEAANRYVMDAAVRARVWRLADFRRRLELIEAPEVPIGSLLEHSIGGVWGSAPGEEGVDVDVLRVTELRANGRLDPRTAARRSISAAQLKSRGLRQGDILLEKSGGGPKSPVGRVGLVRDLEGPSICSNFMQLLRPNADLVIPRYLHLVLNNLQETGGTAHLQTASTNIRNIKASEYLKLTVTLPSLLDQAEVVRETDAALEAVVTLASAVDSARRRGEAMRRALLAAAFSGQLTGRASDMDRVEELADV